MVPERHWTPERARADGEERERIATRIELRLANLRGRSREITKAAATLEREVEDIGRDIEALAADVERFAELWSWRGYA